MLEPIKKSRLYENIVDRLKEMIANGVLNVGDKIPPERILAEQLNVSRTSVREALRSLEMMGYLETRVGDGCYIKEVDLAPLTKSMAEMLTRESEIVLDLLEAREIFEVESARLATTRGTDEEFAEMSKALEYMKTEIESGDKGLKGDDDFHNLILKATHNVALEKIGVMLGDLLSKSREITLTDYTKSIDSLEEHKEILKAMKLRDDKMAVKLMKKHIRSTRKTLNLQGQNKSKK